MAWFDHLRTHAAVAAWATEADLTYQENTEGLAAAVAMSTVALARIAVEAWPF
jgi:hypothetical protein